jgi:3-oxoacyl-[acyl-carrier protein] reductase
MSICIIGASSSLGKELLRQSQFRDERVIATYNSTSIKDPKAELVKLDLGNSSEINNFQPHDVSHLIISQGLLLGETIGKYNEADIDHAVDINLKSTLHLLNNMIRNKSFSDSSLITFISSIAAIRGSYDLVYSASKSALIGCAKSIAINSNPNLRANVICPGLLDQSSMFDSMSSSDHQRHAEQTPTGQLTKIEDLAEFILMLDQPIFKNLNGAVINWDGGRYL